MLFEDISAGRVENISRLSAEDKALFEDLLKRGRQNPLDYSNCWEYLIQSTFFDSFKFWDGKNFVAFTVHRPNSLPFVITKAVGSNPRAAILQVAHLLREISGEKVIVKNLSEYDFEFLEKNGFEDYREPEGWNKFCRYDDDTFPEPVIDLAKTLSLKGKKLKLLRYRLRRLKQPLEVKLYDPLRDFSDAKIVLDKWSKDIAKRFSQVIKQDKIFLHSVDLHRKFMENNGGKSLLFYLNGRPVGFSLIAPISHEAVAVYSIMCDNEIEGLSETVYYETMKKAFEAGYKYCNLGGSEFESLHNYKLKFAPFTFVRKRHAVLY